MTPHASCEDCSWDYDGEDLVDVSDEADRHERKEMHSVTVERVATDGGQERPAWVADCEDCEFRKVVEEGQPTRTIDERATDIGHGHGSTLDHEVEVRPLDPEEAEIHHCDICNTTFYTIVDLIDHDCDDHRDQRVATDGGNLYDIDCEGDGNGETWGEAADRISPDAEVDLSCPEGCIELTISASHDARDARKWLDEIATPDDLTECPECGTTIPRADGMLCQDCGVTHMDWSYDGEHAVDDGHHAGIVERWECGNCSTITEGGRR